MRRFHRTAAGAERGTGRAGVPGAAVGTRAGSAGSARGRPQRERRRRALRAQPEDDQPAEGRSQAQAGPAEQPGAVRLPEDPARVRHRPTRGRGVS
ncbi:hypothetical protein G6F59_016546 [Rhizopus arrhizus]|nr:hypothetical protein G6F59_016546 [Rhizopus arrhizus]